MQLSKNFNLKEFLINSYGLNLHPTAQDKQSLMLLCKNVLQPIRDKYGLPMRITSGLRDIVLTNTLIEDGYAASKSSQHMIGQAADFQFICDNNTEMLMDCFDWCKSNLDFGQMIIYLDYKDKIIHISSGKKNQRMVRYDGTFIKHEGDIEEILG